MSEEARPVLDEQGSIPRARFVDWVIVGAALAIGLVIRLTFRNHTTFDTSYYLIPWYGQARAGGWQSVAEGLTNYTPFYSYLLLFATVFDGQVQPLTLIKAISFVFEFGCAAVAYWLIRTATSSMLRASLTFAAVWLSPAVLYNGALWGQADAIWTFFVLLAIHLICRERFAWAILAFAVGVSVKLQAVFLGPIIFALVLSRRLHWLWLASIPAVYAMLALPTVVAGRPWRDIALVYWDQAKFFHALSKGAANLWMFVPPELYAIGVPIGLALAAGAGLALSIHVSRVQRWTPAFVLLMTTLSLQLMPWVLPKMHERYFYAFEVGAIVLAFSEPRLVLLAVVAQLDAVLSYLPFDYPVGVPVLGAPLAALLNSTLLLFLMIRVVTGRFDNRYFTRTIAVVVTAYSCWLFGSAVLFGVNMLNSIWPVERSDVLGLVLFVAGVGAILLIIQKATTLEARRRLPLRLKQ